MSAFPACWFRRLTLRSATGTAQRACPYLEKCHHAFFRPAEKELSCRP